MRFFVKKTFIFRRHFQKHHFETAVIDEEPFASGAFRGAYKARISSTEKGKTYVIKKYLQGTYILVHLEVHIKQE